MRSTNGLLLLFMLLTSPVTIWPVENATDPTRPLDHPLDHEKQRQEEEEEKKEDFAWNLDEELEEEDYIN